jgi:dihydroxy-acid dehydratase
MISLDVKNRSLNVEVSTEEMTRRKKNFSFPKPVTERGYVKLYIDHVQQAHLGADMDFLTGGSGSEVLRDSH